VDYTHDVADERAEGVDVSDRGFPAQPGEVTPAWLTAQLRAAGAFDSAQSVTGFVTTPIGEGAGMLGVLARLELKVDGPPSAVSSVVVKCATPTVANRAVAMTFHLYEREVRFFRELADHIGEGVPACYAGEIDLDTGDFVLVLEDLADYRPGDQAAGCGLADTERCIEVMARLHSAWWGATDSAQLAWVPTVDGDLHRGGMVPAAEATWDPFIANFGHLVAPQLVDAGPRYLAALTGLHHQMGQGAQTLIHGDFRLDNLLFGDGPDQHSVALVDWQGLIISKGVHDLAYLLTQNVQTDVRRDHERDLVASYCAQLAAHGVNHYSFDQCWDDYRLAALWLFEYAIIIGGGLDPANERGSAFMTGLIQRSSQAIVDLDLLNMLPS
jgi:aminoglycoside/choline kinase family phosphotransferase